MRNRDKDWPVYPLDRLRFQVSSGCQPHCRPEGPRRQQKRDDQNDRHEKGHAGLPFFHRGVLSYFACSCFPHSSRWQAKKHESLSRIVDVVANEMVRSQAKRSPPINRIANRRRPVKNSPEHRRVDPLDNVLVDVASSLAPNGWPETYWI